jgi:Xaa-Pro aminopeptidase
VHDGDPCKYQTQPLEPGMVISNEPGFYGDIALTIGDVRYKESIGIRIEDNLLVTKTGCKNITPCIKAIKDIEAALA